MNKPQFLSSEPSVGWFTYSIQKSEYKDNSVELAGSDFAGKNPYKIHISGGRDSTGQDVIDAIRGMAQRLQYYESEYHRLNRDAEQWHPSSENPDSPYSSRPTSLVQVDSEALRYIWGPCMGYVNRKTNKWMVVIDGNPVEHDVEIWRHFPAPPRLNNNKTYEDVKDEVLRLRSFLKKN